MQNFWHVKICIILNLFWIHVFKFSTLTSIVLKQLIWNLEIYVPRVDCNANQAVCSLDRRSTDKTVLGKNCYHYIHFLHNHYRFLWSFFNKSKNSHAEDQLHFLNWRKILHVKFLTIIVQRQVSILPTPLPHIKQALHSRGNILGL